MQLKDRVAIVTGASSGIGRATARLFVDEGAKVVVAGRRKAELDALVAELGEDAVALAGDVGDESHACALVELACTRFGGLDVAFNNAGTLGPMMETHQVDEDAWSRTLHTNLTSAFFAAKHQVPAMVERGGGSIVFTSTFVGATAGFPGMASYAASKSGLLGLVRALAVELGHHPIRVNALLPGGTDTPMASLVASTPEARAHIASLHALGRIASPVEIARSALYLASDASSFTTGSALLVDGGISVMRG